MKPPVCVPCTRHLRPPLSSGCAGHQEPSSVLAHMGPAGRPAHACARSRAGSLRVASSGSPAAGAVLHADEPSPCRASAWESANRPSCLPSRTRTRWWSRYRRFAIRESPAPSKSASTSATGRGSEASTSPSPTCLPMVTLSF